MKGSEWQDSLLEHAILHFLHKMYVTGAFLLLLKTNVTKAFLHKIHVTNVFLHQGIGVQKYFTKPPDLSFST